MDLQGSFKTWVTAIGGMPDDFVPTLRGYQDDHAAGTLKNCATKAGTLDSLLKENISLCTKSIFSYHSA